MNLIEFFKDESHWFNQLSYLVVTVICFCNAGYLAYISFTLANGILSLLAFIVAVGVVVVGFKLGLIACSDTNIEIRYTK